MSESQPSLLDAERVDRWMRGEITLRELSGVSGQDMQEMAARAHAWAGLGRYDDARTVLQGLIALEPREPYFWSALGGLNLAQEHPGLAERQCSYAIALDPKDPAPYVNRGDAALRQGRLTEAVEDFRRAIELDPQSKNPLTGRARVLAQAVLTALQGAGAAPAAKAAAPAAKAKPNPKGKAASPKKKR